jgi:hypothetical protein
MYRMHPILVEALVVFFVYILEGILNFVGPEFNLISQHILISDAM